MLALECCGGVYLTAAKARHNPEPAVRRITTSLARDTLERPGWRGDIEGRIMSRIEVNVTREVNLRPAASKRNHQSLLASGEKRVARRWKAAIHEAAFLIAFSIWEFLGV